MRHALISHNIEMTSNAQSQDSEYRKNVKKKKKTLQETCLTLRSSIFKMYHNSKDRSQDALCANVLTQWCAD